MNGPPIVLLEKLTKSFCLGGAVVHALLDADLLVFQGETVAVIGPSGSGKSTLLNLLGCLDSPTSGTYYLKGLDVSAFSEKELSAIRGNEIGFVFQSYNLIAQFNVFENIALPFQYQSPLLSKEEIEQRVLGAVEKVRLSGRLYHLPSQLSGEAQRVAIARALAIRPLLILADEPTGSLDSKTGESILELFCELNEQGSTFIIVTHSEHVAAHCKRRIFMQDGLILPHASREKRC